MNTRPSTLASSSARSTRSANRFAIVRSASSGSTFSRRATLTAANSTSPSSSKTCGSGSASGSGLPGGLERLLQLAELVLQVGEGAGRVGVLELDRSRAALQLAGVEQRRERLGNVVEDPFPPLVGALDLLPVRAHASGRSRLDLAEHVRVPPHELVVDPAGRLLEVAVPLLLEQEREEVDLEEQVAELVE